MGTKFFIIFVKYVVYDWGLGAQVLHMTDSKLHLFNCDKSCSIDSDELVSHQNRSDICWNNYTVFPVHRQRQYSLTTGQWGYTMPIYGHAGNFLAI